MIRRRSSGITTSAFFAGAAWQSAPKVQGIGVIGANDRGFDTHIASAFETPLESTSCINCGQCIVACPVGALYERDDTDKVFEALADPKKHVLICAAPSVRAQIGECFGYEPGTDVEGKMVAAIKALGFEGVYDMNMTADDHHRGGDRSSSDAFRRVALCRSSLPARPDGSSTASTTSRI